MIENISVVIIAKDSQSTIEDVLKSLKEFKEVILYLNNSTDDTEKKAKEFYNVKIIDGEFLGFGKTKNKASSFSTNNWILSLDSDEVLTKEFVDSLKKIELNKSNIYQINRVNFYKSKQIKHCWGDEKIVRLYNKEVTTFTDSDVHEKIISKGLEVKTIDGVVKHYPYSTIEQFVTKANTYSTLFAKNNVGKKSSSPSKALLNSIYSFIKTYIFKKGFLDGYIGLIIAYSHGVTNFYKYIKLYELNLEKKKEN